MGLIGAAARVQRFPAAHVPSGVPAAGARWLQALGPARATHSGPNFAFDLCVRRVTDRDREALDLADWRVAFTGSEPVRAATIDAFARGFARCGFRRHAFRPAYDLAESTLLVTTTRSHEAPRTLRLRSDLLRQGRAELQGTGRPGERDGTTTVVGCGWTSAARGWIVDPAPAIAASRRRRGGIWVSGSVARGYWRQPDDTPGLPRLAATGEGPFLRTGDLGFVHDGQLFVTGRIKDTMIVRGLKHDPHDVELTVEAADPAVRPGGCAAFTWDTETEAVAIAVEVELQPDSDDGWRARLMDSIRAAVADGHGIQPRPDLPCSNPAWCRRPPAAGAALRLP